MSSKIPVDLLYTKTHQWLKKEDGIAVIGITDYAQKELGTLTWVEFPEPGKKIKKEQPAASVESIKAVSDVMSPISGTVLEVNSKLENNPEICNRDPYNEGWLIKMKIEDENQNLLTAKEYERLLNSK